MVVLTLLLAVLPSGLKFQQTSPTEVLEYAPVPPEGDERPPSTPGNLSSLGLGGSASFGAGAADEPTALGSLQFRGAGKNPSTKRCVGNPPRQTEDPLSPPCVAFFSGDNHGSTYSGVNRQEIRVVFYDDLCLEASRRGNCPVGIVDLAEPPDESTSHILNLPMLRAYQRYFNDRYQTYGRFVHFYWQFRPNGNAEVRRADAAEARAKVDPFAVVNIAIGPFSEEYTLAMTADGVLAFASPFIDYGRQAKFFRQYPGLLWSFGPSVEQRARIYASHVCSQVAGRSTQFSGNPEDAGKPRRLGLLRMSFAGLASQVAFGNEVRRELQAQCGVVPVVERAFDSPSSVRCVDGDDAVTAVNDMQAFREAGVTTILWVVSQDGCHVTAAASLGYRPEIVVAGDGIVESNGSGQLIDQTVWQHARAITPYTRVVRHADRPCFVAAREADAQLRSDYIANYACDWYPGILQLFTGVQVAGPRLTPESMDKGFHAIPPHRGADPTVPACFYEPDDYTCVKDAATQWWDPAGQGPDESRNGCWRMMEQGRRHLWDEWSSVELESRRGPDDRCNGQGRRIIA